MEHSRRRACLYCTQNCYRTHGKGKPIGPTTPCFTTVVPQNTLTKFGNSWLQIPSAFVQKYGLHFKQENNLEGPSGQIWQVDCWGPTVSSVGFRNGWNVFANDNRIAPGDVLVFKLVSNSHFIVQVFGEDGLEKKHSFNANNTMQCADLSVGTSAKTMSAIEEQGIVQDVEKDVTSPLAYKRKQARGKVMAGASEGTAEEGTAEEGAAEVNVYKSQRREVSALERQQAIIKAEKFHTANPALSVVMKESQVYRGFWMGLKTEFAREWMPEEIICLTLIDSEEKEWTAKWIGCRKNPGLSGGWRKFALDHRLEEGDVCIFEIVNGDIKRFAFKIHIFRVVELEPEQQTMPTKSTKDSRNKQSQKSPSAKPRGRPSILKSSILKCTPPPRPRGRPPLKDGGSRDRLARILEESNKKRRLSEFSCGDSRLQESSPDKENHKVAAENCEAGEAKMREVKIERLIGRRKGCKEEEELLLEFEDTADLPTLMSSFESEGKNQWWVPMSIVSPDFSAVHV